MKICHIYISVYSYMAVVSLLNLIMCNILIFQQEYVCENMTLDSSQSLLG